MFAGDDWNTFVQVRDLATQDWRDALVAAGLPPACGDSTSHGSQGLDEPGCARTAHRQNGSHHMRHISSNGATRTGRDAPARVIAHRLSTLRLTSCSRICWPWMVRGPRLPADRPEGVLSTVGPGIEGHGPVPVLGERDGLWAGRSGRVAELIGGAEQFGSGLIGA